MTRARFAVTWDPAEAPKTTDDLYVLFTLHPPEGLSAEALERAKARYRLHPRTYGFRVGHRFASFWVHQAAPPAEVAEALGAVDHRAYAAPAGLVELSTGTHRWAEGRPPGRAATRVPFATMPDHAFSWEDFGFVVELEEPLDEEGAAIADDFHRLWVEALDDDESPGFRNTGVEAEIGSTRIHFWLDRLTIDDEPRVFLDHARYIVDELARFLPVKSARFEGASGEQKFGDRVGAPIIELGPDDR